MLAIWRYKPCSALLHELIELGWHSTYAGSKEGTALQQSPFAIGVLDVEPDDVIRHVILIKAGIDSLDISLVTIVPAALVVTNGEVLR